MTLSSWSTTWHQFLASWQPSALGTTAPPSPAFGALGALGTVLLGGMGLTEKVLVLGSIPFGAWGVSRLLRAFGSPRACLVGALELPRAPTRLRRAGPWPHSTASSRSASPPGCSQRSCGRPPSSPSSRRSGATAASRPRVQLLGLGRGARASASRSPRPWPSSALVCGLGLWLRLALGRGARPPRGGSSRRRSGAIVIALVLCLPWVIGTALVGQPRHRRPGPAHRPPRACRTYPSCCASTSGRSARRPSAGCCWWPRCSRSCSARARASPGRPGCGRSRSLSWLLGLGGRPGMERLASRRRSTCCWRRPPSPSPPASASGSPPSRPTCSATASGGASW